MWAAIHDHREIMDALIKAGALLNIQEKLGNTALMLAAAFFKLKAVGLLVRAGADRNVKNNQGNTALDLIRRHGY